MKRELKIFNFDSTANFKEGHQIILSIQNIGLFRKYATELFNATSQRNSDSEIKLWEELKEIKFYKTADFISNLWTHEFINSRFKRLLYAQIEKVSYENNIGVINKIEIHYDELLDLLKELWKDQIITFNYAETFELSPLLKSIDLQPEIIKEGSIIDNLYTYTDFVAEINLFEMFIFVNLSHVMTKQEFEYYVEYTLGKGIDCLFLESSVVETSNSKTIVIDNDFYDYML